LGWTSFVSADIRVKSYTKPCRLVSP
jgi:hypothetical protein